MEYSESYVWTYGRSSLHLQDIVSSRSLHSCKGLYRTERRTASLRIEVQLMVVCTDILQLIFHFFFLFSTSNHMQSSVEK